MKIRLTISAVVIIASWGFAFADVKGTERAWVHVKFAGQVNFICVNTNINCDETGTIPCMATIQSLKRTTMGYGIGCAYQLLSTDATIIYDPPAIIIDAD